MEKSSSQHPTESAKVEKVANAQKDNDAMSSGSALIHLFKLESAKLAATAMKTTIAMSSTSASQELQLCSQHLMESAKVEKVANALQDNDAMSSDSALIQRRPFKLQMESVKNTRIANQITIATSSTSASQELQLCSQHPTESAKVEKEANAQQDNDAMSSGTALIQKQPSKHQTESAKRMKNAKMITIAMSSTSAFQAPQLCSQYQMESVLRTSAQKDNTAMSSSSALAENRLSKPQSESANQMMSATMSIIAMNSISAFQALTVTT
jgi:hypothetical protein